MMIVTKTAKCSLKRIVHDESLARVRHLRGCGGIRAREPNEGKGRGEEEVETIGQATCSCQSTPHETLCLLSKCRQALAPWCVWRR